jgi:hypothetical protein
MVDKSGEISMHSWIGWSLLTAIIFGGFYMHSTKPICHDGFTPIIGFGVGWYCTPGYKP